MLKPILAKLIDGENLSIDEARKATEIIMEGNATDAQIGAFLVALRLKGETPDEITGCAMVMREKAAKITTGDPLTLDTCGTGGDKSFTYNISTATAIVVASTGIKVAKHGNRSVSSHCGCADVLSELGVNIEAPVPVVEKCLREANIGFLFAPLLHGAMKYAINPRRQIGVRTIFNILGPLTNPAGADRQLLGVFSKDLTQTLARVLKNLGSTHAFIVHGEDGLDEVTTTSRTFVTELNNGEITSFTITPEDFGIERATVKDLQSSSVEEGAKIIRDIFAGAKTGANGPKRDVVILNSAFALRACDVVGSIEEGIEKAAEAIDSGEAGKTLDKLIAVSNSG